MLHASADVKLEQTSPYGAYGRQLLRATLDKSAGVSCALGNSKQTLVKLNAAPPVALVAASTQLVAGLRVRLLSPVLLC